MSDTTHDTENVDPLRQTAETPAAERLAQIRARSQRLAAIPMETGAGNSIMRDMIDTVGDVQWLLKQLEQEYGVQREGSKVAAPAHDEAAARKRADIYSRIHEPGSQPRPHHVVHRLATAWQRVEQGDDRG